MNGHVMETTEAGTRCSRHLRTTNQVNRSQRWRPGIPWYVAGDAPRYFVHTAPTQEAVGCVVTAYNDLVKLYDLAETKPRQGETERQRAARVATWSKTQEKWRCTH